MIEPWQVLDVSEWTEELPEKRGTRVKIWLRASDGRRFLFKEPEQRRPTEVAAEALSQRIARAVGLSAAQTWPGTRSVGGAQVRGLASLDFTTPGSSLTAGAALMSQFDPRYDPETQKGEHTLPRVRSALTALEARAGAALVLPFARMLILDAWLGNGDRHPANWSIIEEGDGGVRLAPIYDTASPFAPELGDAHVLVTHGHDYDVRLDGYVGRCSSGFGRGGVDTISQEKVLDDLRSWPEYGTATGLVDRFRDLMRGDPPLYIQEISGEWLPAAARPAGSRPVDQAARVAGGQAMTRRTDRLLVLWSDPGRIREGQRHIVGELWRDGEGHAFAYRRDLTDAKKAGFGPFTEFPDLRGVDRPYRSRHLFWTFAERIPSPRRPDYKALMRSWGVEDSDDQFEVLALSGGVQATDRIELAEYRDASDDLSEPLRFRLAGERFSDGTADVREGDALKLRPEPTNPVDRFATQVLFKGDRKIGYVPAQYSRLFATLLGAGLQIDARVFRRLMLPEERDRLVVRARNVDGRAAAPRE